MYFQKSAISICKYLSWLTTKTRVLTESITYRSCLICAESINSTEFIDPTETTTLNGHSKELSDGDSDPFFPTSSPLCSNCIPKLARRVHYEPYNNSICGIHELRSIWKMEAEIDTLLKAFKYRSLTPLATPLAHALATYLIQTFHDASYHRADPEHSNLAMNKWDLIVPVPSSPTNERSRRFSHTALISQKLSKILKIPCNLTGLRSVKTGSRQTQTAIVNRAQNIANRFYTTTNLFLNQSILLIDDTTTSGETLAAAAFALHKAGATQIDALTIAQSPRFYANIKKIKSSNIALKKT